MPLDEHLNRISVVNLPIQDSITQDIRPVLECISNAYNANYITSSHYKVLICCNQGISRSATVVIYLLMKYHGMNLKQAFLFVKSKRRIILPNTHFMHTLVEVEKELYDGVSTLDIGPHGQLYWKVSVD